MQIQQPGSNGHNLIGCKACGNTIAKGVNKCPHCGKDQRNFFLKHKFLTGILALVVLAGIGSALTDIEKDKIDYVAYNYGDAVAENNVRKENDFKIPDGLTIVIEDQSLVSIDEINDANPFNDADNNVAALEVTFINETDEPISYNTLGFTFVTQSNVQLEDLSFSLNVLPDNYEDMDSFSSGDLMPGSQFTRLITKEVPENDLISVAQYCYSGVNFTIDLPE